MKSLLIRNLVRPLVERVGTMLAAALIAYGWDGELVHQFITALSAVALVSFDLAVARFNRDAG